VESATRLVEANRIQALLSEYKEDSKNIQRQVNRLAELLEMSGLKASFENSDDGSASGTKAASPLVARTPVRPGLMMLESTPGLITGMSATSRNALNTAQSRRHANVGPFSQYSSHSARPAAAATRETPSYAAARTPRSVTRPHRRPPPPQPQYLAAAAAAAAAAVAAEPYIPRATRTLVASAAGSHMKRQHEAEFADVLNVSAEAVMEEMRQFVATPAKERILREAEIQRAMTEMKYEVGLYD
jgi:hypothetical protein